MRNLIIELVTWLAPFSLWIAMMVLAMNDMEHPIMFFAGLVSVYVTIVVLLWRNVYFDDDEKHTKG